MISGQAPLAWRHGQQDKGGRAGQLESLSTYQDQLMYSELQGMGVPGSRKASSPVCTSLWVRRRSF